MKHHSIQTPSIRSGANLSSENNTAHGLNIGLFVGLELARCHDNADRTQPVNCGTLQAKALQLQVRIA